MPDVPLRAQLACARRELALRVRVYERRIMLEAMSPGQAEHELAAMLAITQTLERLVAAEGGGQAERVDARGGSEAQP